MKIIIFFVVLYTIIESVHGQHVNAFYIPDSLKKGANVVKRNEEYIFEIKEAGKAKIYEKHVYTILNSKAQYLTKYKSFYNKFITINSVSGVLYDFAGKELKHLKKKDWQDISAYDGFSLINDQRVKINEFFYNEYPFTVEYEEENEVDGIMSILSWFPVSDYGMSVQRSKYTIIAPSNYEIRYKSFNFSEKPVITEKDGKKIYSWVCENIPAVKKENNAPDFNEIVPNIKFAPSDIEIEGYKGNMSSWKNFGKFMNQLLIDKDELPLDVKTMIHTLTDHLNTEKEKVFALYDYMQKNTHYISIQLGIGGWQPFNANYVASNKYGDCKALSNFMIALLKEIDIDAKYVLINAGENASPLIEDFSSNQFNHAVCCVPMGKDTLWLECTNQTVSPGYMGSFTGNRKAVLIDTVGGTIVKTPEYSSKENIRKCYTKSIINNEGFLDATINNQYSGIEQELPHALMHEASEEMKEKYLNIMLNIPTYEVIHNEYSQEKGMLPYVNENIQIKAKAFATITGKRMFINPNIIYRNTERITPDSSRKFDYIVNNSFTHQDSSVFIIPEGYKAEHIPKEITLNTKFGTYNRYFIINGNQIVYFRKEIKDKARYSPSEYMDLVNYFDLIYKADRDRIVLIKETTN